MEAENHEAVVVSLRRYPVKSMGGEALQSVMFDDRGLAGDRGFAVRDGEDRLASGKNTKRLVRRDGIFEYTARSVSGGHQSADHVVVSRGGTEWRAGDPELDAHLTDALSAEVRVASESDLAHFDAGSVSLVGTATLDWCARELGVDADPRRLRVNIVVQTVEPFEEESWVGDVTVGDVVLRPATRIKRCRVIDLPQDGLDDSTRWLKPLGDQRDAQVAIYLDVTTPGLLRVGDIVRVGDMVRVGDQVHPPATSAP